MSSRDLVWGKWSFPSKASAIRECQLRLSKLQHLEILEGDNASFFFSLFAARHPEPSRVEGYLTLLQYVEWKKIDPSGFNSKGLRVLRQDEDPEPISWLFCISPTENSDWVRAACRHEISEQIEATRHDHMKKYGLVSAISGASDEALHVDHHPVTFEALFQRWSTSIGGDVSKMKTERHGSSAWRLSDRDLAHDWREFHLKHASLRVITKTENLSLSRSQ